MFGLGTKARQAALGSTPFAVVDVETTGFSPLLHDRIVEIAIVRVAPDGQIAEEYSTLVNPGRDVGPTHVHGITASDVLEAPPFSEVAGDIAARLNDSILVGHNLRFDIGFLLAEFLKLGCEMPPQPGLCTLALSFRLRSLPSRKLQDCCDEMGIVLDGHHLASEDAKATAALLLAYLALAKKRGLGSLEQLGCEILELPAAGWAPGRGSGKRLTRSVASERRKSDRSYLARLVELLPGTEAASLETASYLSLLDRALEDRRITAAEADALMAMAKELGLSRADVLEAHHAYLDGLATAALEDQVVTEIERRDLEEVARVLGLSPEAVEAALTRAGSTPAPAADVSAQHELAGKSVCFTGALSGKLDGEVITREQAEKLARGAGLIVRAGVTKKLDILVAADPNTLSGKGRKARDYGTRVMAEMAFWRAIRVPVE